MRASPFVTAVRLTAEQFPDCVAAVLGGSAGAGTYNEHSDLDLVIVVEGEADFFRKVIRYQGWTVECIVVSTERYRELFDAGIRDGNPSLQRLLAEGVTVSCRRGGERIIEEARRDVAAGPMPLSAAEIDEARYFISDQLADIRGAAGDGERWFAAGRAAELVCKFLLRVNGRWVAEGKYLMREVAAFAPEIALRIEQSLRALYVQGDPLPFTNVCAEILDPYGGFLLEGFEE